MRDSDYPSHAAAPLYKGVSSDFVRDRGFYRQYDALILSQEHLVESQEALHHSL